jgi:hypothetical protein
LERYASAGERLNATVPAAWLGMVRKVEAKRRRSAQAASVLHDFLSAELTAASNGTVFPAKGATANNKVVTESDKKRRIPVTPPTKTAGARRPSGTGAKAATHRIEATPKVRGTTSNSLVTPPRPISKKRIEKEPRAYLGRRVAKFFDAELFLGTVAGYQKAKSFWKIEYDDGDKEEFDVLDMVEYMSGYEKHQDMLRWAGTKTNPVTDV